MTSAATASRNFCSTAVRVPWGAWSAAWRLGDLLTLLLLLLAFNVFATQVRTDAGFGGILLRLQHFCSIPYEGEANVFSRPPPLPGPAGRRQMRARPT